MKSQGEIEAAVCDAVSRFQQEYMGRGPRHVHTHLVENRLFVHLQGVLTAAEQRLIEGRGNGDGRGIELLKQLRSQLVQAGQALLETLLLGVGDSRIRILRHRLPGQFLQNRVLLVGDVLLHFQFQTNWRLLVDRRVVAICRQQIRMLLYVN